MTKYEALSITISIVAILIPLIQILYKRFVVKAELRFYSTGRAFLYSNISGSYIRIEGVYEALKKATSVKNIAVKVKRKKDDAILNLNWSMITNPVNQQIMGAYASSSEIAHPFRVEADSIATAFIEYTDFYNSSAKMIKPYIDSLNADLQSLLPRMQSYDEAREHFISLESYKKALEALHNELFWQIGCYELAVITQYGDSEKRFMYEFCVSEENWDDLNNNICESLDVYLKNYYRVQSAFRTVQVEVREASY